MLALCPRRPSVARRPEPEQEAAGRKHDDGWIALSLRWFTTVLDDDLAALKSERELLRAASGGSEAERRRAELAMRYVEWRRVRLRSVREWCTTCDPHQQPAPLDFL